MDLVKEERERCRLGRLNDADRLVSPSSAQECPRIRNPTERLKCYDAKEELSKPASGPWERVLNPIVIDINKSAASSDARC